jgi:plasmid stabilization system protein ParE
MSKQPVDYYAHEADPDIAFRFIEALRSAYRTIAERPAVGSHRYALDLALPRLRNWAVKGFPYLVFYIERDDHIDVWRGAARPTQHTFTNAGARGLTPSSCRGPTGPC